MRMLKLQENVSSRGVSIKLLHELVGIGSLFKVDGYFHSVAAGFVANVVYLGHLLSFTSSMTFSIILSQFVVGGISVISMQL